MTPHRRHLLTTLATLAGAPLLLPGCASSPWPSGFNAQHSTSAAERLLESAQAHGLAAWRGLRDVNVAYAGEWRALIGRLQPVLVDAGFRGRSEERLLPAAGLLAQAHTGPAGRKQVLRRTAAGHGAHPGQAQDLGSVQVWRNGQAATDRDELDAAALVCDGYRLFLLGPLLLVDVPRSVAWGAPEVLDGRMCDVLHVTLVPGIGRSPQDKLALVVDRQQALVRRLRLSLEGLQSTVGAVAEVDCADHVQRHGVWWPTRFAERLVSPLPGMPVHDWRLTGLDVNRGYLPTELEGPVFGPLAARPAAALGAAA